MNLTDIDYFRLISPDMPLRLTPGPFEVSPRVLAAASSAFCGHRTPFFRAVMRETRANLLRAYDVDHQLYECLLLTGTGSAAMEMMVAATVGQRRPLALVNGRFGRRLADMALIYNPETVVLEFPDGSPIKFSAVERALDETRADQLLFCAQDTRDAILNPYAELCRAAKARGAIVTMDAISAALFEPIDFQGLEVDCFVDSSGKGARSLPGVGILVVKHALVAALSSRDPRTYYLDLHREYRMQKQHDEPSFAPAVSLYAALGEAIAELLEEGVGTRQAIVRGRTELVRSRLLRSGLFRMLRPSDEMPASVTSFILKEGWRFDRFAAELEPASVLVYPGSSTRDDVIQIGTGGFLTDGALDYGIESLTAAARRLGECDERGAHAA